MKKIYIFAAVLALLTLSLNAQLKATKKGVVQPTTTTEKVDIKFDRYFPTSPLRAGEVTPPYTCGFSDDEIDGWALIDANQDNSRWGLSEEQAVYQYNSSNAANDWLVSPGIRLQAGKTYKFYIDAKCRSTGYPERLEVKMASAVDATALTNGTTIIGSTVVNYTSYQTLSNENVTVSADGIYYIGIHAISDRDMWLLYVDNFVLDGETDPIHDLSIALSAPTQAAAGNTVTLTATVTNTGEFDENGYTVTFTANGTTINTQTGGALASGASATFTYTYTTTDAQGGTTVNFGASVACTDDAVADNNNATASTSLIVLPPPENVAATAEGNSGTMTWDAPIIASTVTQVTETFENTADNVLPSGWTAIDNDGDGYNWYHHININDGNNISTHDGVGAMASESYNNDTQSALYPENWLITPLAVLDGTFSFWAVGQDESYPSEVFGVFVTTGDDPSNLSNYVQVAGDFTATDTYAQYTANLSAYAGQLGYIAIVHHNVSDQFILNVDDVNYQAAVPGEQPVSYNVYLEGELVGNVDANTFTYTFNNLSDGTYNCAVSAVYDLGESAAVPTSFTIDTTNPTIEITPETQTISDAAAAALTVTGTDIEGNINVSAGNDWSLNPTSLGNTGGDVSVSYTGRDLSATTTVTATAANDNNVSATATVNYVADVYIVGDFGTGWNFSDNTHPMSYNNGTYTATITVNAENYILFARLLGNSNPWNTRDVFGPSSNNDWVMPGDNAEGTLNLYGSNCIKFPEGGTYRITINANDNTFTITKVSGEQTAPPVITSSSDGEYVTITATGNGTVTLNVPGYDPVSGEGSVSITVPCGYASNTITVTATAQESGKLVSDPASSQVNIPAGSGWTEMDGTYDNPNDLLSFLKDGEDIMMVDQFLAPTKENKHPDHYTYTLRQTVNGETQTSTPVTIPVYKTSSTMQGLYTKTQVDNDINMDLKANVVNTEMDYNVNPDRNVLYYSLYRGEVNDVYPEITEAGRISQLQKFEEMDANQQVQYYMFENHQTGVAPRYDHVGNEMVERLDTIWAYANPGDTLSYVPVIWTFGLYTARGDGKNNSYGSDIKREQLGDVHATYGGQLSDGPYGTYTYNGTMYRICHPVINITGIAPVTRISKDGDVSTYVPYMYRAWCTTEGMRDFKLISGQGFEDAGAINAPFLLGTEVTSNTECPIGGVWDSGKKPWAFAIPDGTTPHFVVRFYYKKIVAEGQNNGTMLTLGNGEGEEYFIAQGEGDGNDIETGIAEMIGGAEPIDVTYVNSLGMQSSKPFKGMNIVVTRYSDGSTSTMKVMK